MKETDLILQEQQWEKEKDLLEREMKLKQEKKNLISKYKNHIPTSKLLILFLFINCTLIEIFTGWVTVKTVALAFFAGMSPDFTPLITLIGAVVSEVIGFAIYSLKSMKENTAGGIVYETAMSELEEDEDEDDEEAVG